MAYPSRTDRAALVAAAIELLSRKGLEGMSIRAVAAALRLAPNALYHYFSSREELIVAVAAQVSARLHALLLDAIKGKRPEQSIRAMAKTYLGFARDHRFLYEVLLIPRPPAGEDAVAPERLWLFLVAQISRVSGEPAAREAAVAIWATLHGMAALQNAAAFNEEMPFSSLEFALQAWMAAARAAGIRGKKSPASRSNTMINNA